MAFDGITVASLVRELNASLADGHISRIAQPEPDEILLSVKTRSGLKKVLLSASASLPLLYLTDQSKLSPMTAPNFCMLLRKHIGSGHILSVTQPSLERIVRFEIEHYDELGDLRKKYLVLELMGKYSNLIFVDENEIILDAIRHVSAQTSSLREGKAAPAFESPVYGIHRHQPGDRRGALPQGFAGIRPERPRISGECPDSSLPRLQRDDGRCEGRFIFTPDYL